MGLIKSTKEANVAGPAREARERGDTVYVCLFKAGWFGSGVMSGPLSHIGGMIQSVEAEGWMLDKFTYDGSDAKTDRVCCLFRRA